MKNAEDETERMRAELLKKEKELLELKQQELDLQIAKYKKQMDQVTIFIIFNQNTVSLWQFLSSDISFSEINIMISNVFL